MHACAWFTARARKSARLYQTADPLKYRSYSRLSSMTLTIHFSSNAETRYSAGHRQHQLSPEPRASCYKSSIRKVYCCSEDKIAPYEFETRLVEVLKGCMLHDNTIYSVMSFWICWVRHLSQLSQPKIICIFY